MIRQLVCILTGHRWRYFPYWITGEPESIRECVRCYRIEQRFRRYGKERDLIEEWWTKVGRRPRIARPK